MAGRTSSQHPAAQRALIALATASAALGAGAATAAAATDPAVDLPHRPASLGRLDAQAGLAGVTGSVPHVTGPVTALKPNPLAGTGVDPLDNGVGTQLADFKPLTSQALTRPVAQAQSVGEMPVVGQAAGLVEGAQR
ncbi:hypothetical protein ACFC09_05990 [Streptomyces sp. NPDC056161]|uniref:hypothetical protein n=1 Tax=Streptomyces sp. NPDC056161 TaxID=3345732 RepID=UPI0035E13B23